MLSDCLECRKNAESKNAKVLKPKNRRIILLSKCEVCDNEKSKLIEEQKARELLSSLVVKKPLSKIPLVSILLF